MKYFEKTLYGIIISNLTVKCLCINKFMELYNVSKKPSRC